MIEAKIICDCCYKSEELVVRYNGFEMPDRWNRNTHSRYPDYIKSLCPECFQELTKASSDAFDTAVADTIQKIRSEKE